MSDRVCISVWLTVLTMITCRSTHGSSNGIIFSFLRAKSYSFLGGGCSTGKESVCNVEDPSSILWLGRSPGEGTGYPLQYSWASLGAQTVKNPLAKQETWVQSLGVGKIPWRRAWQPTPVFLPGEFHGQRSLAGYSQWSLKEPNTTKWPSLYI